MHQRPGTLLLAAFLGGCGPGEATKPGPTTTPTPTTPTTPWTTSGALVASCVADPVHAVRAQCTLDGVEGPVEIDVAAGEDEATFSTTVGAGPAQVTLWGLLAETTWSWTARAGSESVSGTFVTGSLPDALVLDIAVQDLAPGRFEHIVAPLSCDPGYVTAFDRQGRIRWYEYFEEPDRPWDVKALFVTPENTVLAIDGHTIREVDLSGGTVLALEDLDLPVHHDVLRQDDLTWVLQADAYPPDASGISYIEDFVSVYDASGALVDRWEQHGALPPPVAGPPSGLWANEFPGAVDAWHSNSLFVTDSGDFLVSLKRANTILQVDAATHDVEWTYVGLDSPVSALFTSDFPMSGPEVEFGEQHHARRLGDTLMLFDNHGDGTSRGLELEIDAAAGELRLARTVPWGNHCATQSSYFDLPDDHRLLTCAPDHGFTEVGPDDEIVWSALASCASGDEPVLTLRGYPIDLWSAVSGGTTARRR